MNKQGFIDGLRGYLSGRVSPRLVEEHANYYEDYINMQIRSGKSETEVLEGLGDPRWIAKTIINANGGDDAQDAGNGYGGSYGTGGSGGYSGSYGSSGNGYGGSYGTGGNDGYGSSYGNGRYGSNNDDYVTPVNGSLIERVRAWFERKGPKLIRIAIILLVLSGVVSLFFSIVGILIPFAIPILFVVFIVKLFKDWLN